MAALVEYANFDQLFLAYNRMRRDLDGKLKPLGLTLTSLQILMAIDELQVHPQQSTRATIAARLGITNSTASIMVGGLIKRGLVVEAGLEYDGKRKTLRLSPKRDHQAIYYKGLAVWDAVLEQWHDALPASKRKAFFAALKSANGSIDRQAISDREERYLKSVSRHSTRANALKRGPRAER